MTQQIFTVKKDWLKFLKDIKKVALKLDWIKPGKLVEITTAFGIILAAFAGGGK